MYGIVHVELKHYIETRYGRDAWTAILHEAGLQNRIYMTVSTYLDAEVHAIMKAASVVTGSPVEALFEDFGLFIVQAMMKTYAPLINPQWGLVELLLHLDDTIYRAIRTRSPGAHPPRLKAEAVAPRVVHLRYDSPRSLPALAKGFLQGAAKHYDETIEIQAQDHPDNGFGITITVL